VENDAASSSHGDTDDVEYNFDTVHNLDLYGCEMAPTVREGMRAWNMTVQYWLATYVYKRVPVRASSFRSLTLNLVFTFSFVVHQMLFIRQHNCSVCMDLIVFDL